MSQTKQKRFGELLKKYRANSIDPDFGGSLTQERLVELIGNHDGRFIYDPSLVSRWQNGTRLGSFKERGLQLALISVLHVCANGEGVEDLEDANELLALLGARDLTRDESAAIEPNWVKADKAQAVQVTEKPNQEPAEEKIHDAPGQNLGRWLKESAEFIFRFSEADEHMRSSPAGFVIYILNRAFRRFADGLFLALMAPITCWLATYFLLSPMWRWQLDDLTVRYHAVLYFSIGSALIPMLIAWTTNQEAGRELNTDTVKKQVTVFAIKFIGATTAFNALAVGYLIFPIFPFSYFETTNQILASGLTWAFLSLFPVFLGYVVAQRIPVDRLKMFGQEPTLHEADKVFGVILSLLGPGTAFGVYVAYEGFQNPIVGWIFLLYFVNVGVWKGRKNNDGTKGILLTVLQFTLLFPTLVLLAYWIINLPVLGFPADMLQFNPTSLGNYSLILSYPVLLVGVYIITLQRNPPQMSFNGMVGFAILAIAIWLMFRFNPDWGAIAFILPFLVYPLIHRWFKPWFWTHPSMACALILVFVSLFFGLQEMVPIWLNFIGFWSISAVLMWWGLQENDL